MRQKLKESFMKSVRIKGKQQKNSKPAKAGEFISFAQIYDLVAKLVQLNSKISDFVNLTAMHQACAPNPRFGQAKNQKLKTAVSIVLCVAMLAGMSVYSAADMDAAGGGQLVF